MVIYSPHYFDPFEVLAKAASLFSHVVLFRNSQPMKTLQTEVLSDKKRFTNLKIVSDFFAPKDMSRSQEV